ncbi:helix-turn-helix domain-containing protein [Streptomyces sp. NPDC053079]|uniref:helix-turn-helix domain-containing protein n=1 Tax=Streptomyces sp. NPDC053079 TaxID=3365697 RepID=UPI0037D23C53
MLCGWQAPGAEATCYAAWNRFAGAWAGVGVGRREKPIGACSKSLAALVSWLRARRESSGLSYACLAERTPYSEDTLARAASGRSVPKLMVVLAFAQACDADLAEAERLWKRARYESRSDGERAQRVAVHIDFVGNFVDLHAALMELYARDGRRPYRELNERAGGYGRLPPATVSRVLNRQVLPSRGFVLSLAQACGVRGAALEAWGEAWDRADAVRRPWRHNSYARNRHHAGHRGQSMLHAPLGTSKMYSATSGMPQESFKATPRTGYGTSCVACGYLVCSHSDMGARMGEYVWCMACADGSLQLNVALINRMRRRLNAQLSLSLDRPGEVSGGEG